MSELLETIAVDRDGEKVLINKSDLSKSDKIWTDKKPAKRAKK